MAFSGPIADRQAIQDLYATYSDASSRGHVDDWLACWTDDGAWDTHLFKRAGQRELREQWDELWASFEKLAFIGQVTAIEVRGDEAAARSMAQEVVRLKDGRMSQIVGLYDDQLVRTQGQWLFARRTYDPVGMILSD